MIVVAESLALSLRTNQLVTSPRRSNQSVVLRRCILFKEAAPLAPKRLGLSLESLTTEYSERIYRFAVTHARGAPARATGKQQASLHVALAPMAARWQSSEDLVSSRQRGKC